MNPMVMVRVLTATALFLMLAKVNVWANTSTHLVLAVGYRSLLLAAPAFMCLGLTKGLRLSLAIGLIAIVSLFFSINPVSIFFFGLSMAVSGYICKYVNSKTAKGAADNKVSLNIGSLFSGVLIFLFATKSLLLGLCAGMLVATYFYSLKLDLGTDLQPIQRAQNKLGYLKYGNGLSLTRWLLIGVATGIKLTGIFAILPQYLIQKTGYLPGWYGSLVIINSLGVIFFQHKIIYWLEKGHVAWTWILALSAMMLLAIPHLLKVEYFPAAAVWIAFLTFGECALSRYDKTASDEGYLFPKELMVGVGSFATVYLSREFGSSIYLSGILGVLCLLGALLCYVFQVGIKTSLPLMANGNFALNRPRLSQEPEL